MSGSFADSLTSHDSGAEARRLVPRPERTLPRKRIGRRLEPVVTRVERAPRA